MNKSSEYEILAVSEENARWLYDCNNCVINKLTDDSKKYPCPRTRNNLRYCYSDNDVTLVLKIRHKISGHILSEDELTQLVENAKNE